MPEQPESEGGSKFKEIGASGLQVVGGRVNEEWLPVLRGERGVRAFREMGDNDPYSGALLYGLLQTVLRSEWTIDLNDALVAEGEFLEQCQDDMEHPFRDVIAEAMTMGQYGWALQEVVFKQRLGPDHSVPSDYDDGRIGWRKMPLRAQETLYQWVVDYEEGEICAMVQRLWGSELDMNRDGTVEIPLSKCLLFRTTHHKNNPEGKSMLRTGWSPYSKRKQIEVFEGIGVERDLAGIPVIYLPADMMAPDAPANQQAALAAFHKMGKNIRADDQSHVIMPMDYDENGNPLYKFELASTQGRRMFDTNAIINRLAVAQLMSIMADVMMIGHEGAGSLALSRTKEEMFTSGVQSMLDEVREILNNYAIPRLFRLNGISAPFPQFSTSPIQRLDPQEFVANVLALAQSGMPLWPDEELDSYIRDFLGWPERANPGEGLSMPMDDGEEPATGATEDPEQQTAPARPASPMSAPRRGDSKERAGNPTKADSADQIETQGADGNRPRRDRNA